MSSSGWPFLGKFWQNFPWSWQNFVCSLVGECGTKKRGEDEEGQTEQTDRPTVWERKQARGRVASSERTQSCRSVGRSGRESVGRSVTRIEFLRASKARS